MNIFILDFRREPKRLKTGHWPGRERVRVRGQPADRRFLFATLCGLRGFLLGKRDHVGHGGSHLLLVVSDLHRRLGAYRVS